MIVELTVENLAIIERSQLTLGPGFTALTGETGAGKSLLIDAIELALGERADSELVRAGAPRATVSVVFDLSTSPELVQRCVELGIPVDDATLYVHREVFAEGRSQCRVGGKLTPVAALRQLGQHLVDLHGQHDHQSLLDADRHIGFLDDWIGQPATDLLSVVAEAAGRADDVRRRLNALRQGQRDREQRLDLLRFQINEIEALNPKLGEMEELEAQLSRLKNVERLAQAAFGSLEALEDREQSADELLSGAVKSIEDALRYDPSLAEIAETLQAALVQLQEGAHALRNYADEIEADPARLDEVATRIDGLRRLRRKYGDDEAAILEFLEKARADLELFEDAEGNEADLSQALEEAEARLAENCAALTSLRKERSIEFAELVQNQLRDLAMDRAIFEVGFHSKPFDATGGDRVEFFFTANAGEPPRPLSKIASGGEISRVMLAIKTAMAGRAGVPTLIFDEVDAGLGGRAAAVVAKKIEELATHYQVLVISHLPQIASRATTHYRIEKVESSGRLVTQVRELRPEERIEEIARMLAGEKVTESAVANAREMLTGKISPSTLFD
jgi:DNA repair protein RecN (Recombination protein N)